MEASLKVKLITVLILIICLPASVKGTPSIDIFDKVATLYEGITYNEILSTITCSDPDGDITRTYVKSMKPASPCAKCFEILDCLPNECLQYRAGVGTLRYSSASSYLLTIACDDGIEPPVTEIVEIKIIPNSPPYFEPDVLFMEWNVDASASGPGTLLYNVDATDDEGDDLEYSMTVTPSSSSGNYAIDPITGEITCTVDLRKECRPDVTFNVFVTDGTTKVGPMVIGTTLDNANVAPIATNLDTTVQIPEDTGRGTVYKMNFVDGNGDPVTYTATSTNAAGLAQYKLDGKNPNVDVAAALDYEKSSLRQTDVVITGTDGYCSTKPHSLRLIVTDVNEKPTLSPEHGSVEVCEYDHEFDPGYVLDDPDAIDTQLWTLHSSMPNIQGYYDINRKNGYLETIDSYNVDNPDAMNTNKEYVAQVEDKGGLTATATVTVSFLDCNDNAPVFREAAVERAATECAAPGSILGTIQADDLDSSREQNNVIVYSGSGGAVSVGSGGQIILNKPLPAGNVITFNAYATDRGQTPGPLRSENPCVISVRFTPCPTPPPPTTTSPTKAVTTTTTTTTTTFTKEEDDPNLPWIIIAALLGTFMIGLLSYMLWKYGSLCRQACENFNCGKRCRGRARRVTPREEPVKEIRRKPMEKKPEPRPKSEPEPEEEEEKTPAGPGFLFGFWKERYPDDDFKNRPNRQALPTPGDMEAHYPHTIDAVEQPPGPGAAASAAADAPNKKCAIM